MSDREMHSDSDPAEEERPWEQPGTLPLDCEPHRGELLLKGANMGVTLGALSMIVPPTAVPGFFFGLVTAALAAYDLKRMRAGRCDPHDQTMVERAQERAVGAMCLSLFGWPVGCVVFFVIYQLVR
jgi:hypothetical protein